MSGSIVSHNEVPSVAKGITSRANGRKGGRPKGSTSNGHLPGRQELRSKAPMVAAEMLRLALHAKTENVRAAACRDILAYAWGRPPPMEGVPGDQTNVNIVNVLTGVRGVGT